MKFQNLTLEIQKILRGSDNTADFYEACWSEVPVWTKAVVVDFKQEFGVHLVVTSVKIFLNELSPSHGSPHVWICIGSPEDERFSLKIEFHLGGQNCQLSVERRSKSANPTLDRLADQIQPPY